MCRTDKAERPNHRRTLYRESAEVVKSIPQERIHERMGKLCRRIEVPEIPRQECVEVDPVLLRTVKQYLRSMSLHRDSLRGFVNG